VENAEEFAEKTKGVLNVDDVREVRVDIVCELVLNSADVDIELNEITIEGVILVVKKRVGDLATERVHIDVEGINNTLNVFKVVLLKGLELADGAEQVDQFSDTSAEELEFAEDLSGVEVELACLGH